MMNKKALYSVLSVIVAMIILSVSLVFAIGPHVSAAHVEEGVVLVFDSRDDYVIDDNGVLTALSESACEEINKYDIYEECRGWWYGSGIESIKYIIPDGVKSINWSWPTGGSMVTSVELPDGLETIGYGAFANLHCLTSIKLPNTVKEIDGMAFDGCESLTSIVIPLSVTEINGDIFDACSGLRKIYCEASDRPAGWDTNWNYFHTYDYYSVDNPYYIDVVWDCNKTITFDTQNGSTVENQTVCVDSLVTKPTDPTKEGYTFKGWYNGEEEYDFTTPVTDSMTLTAKWEAIPEPEQPEPSNPEPTEPEITNPETPSEQENTETVKNENNNKTLALGIAGGSVAGLGAISAVVAIIIAKKRRK